MEDFRSNSCGDLRMEIQSYYGSRATSSGPRPPRPNFRCYSTSYASSSVSQTQTQMSKKEIQFKKGKSCGSSSKIWNFNDPEFQRKKRVASYRIYTVEGKMKGSFRKSFRWIKDRYTQVLYGWW